MNVDSLEDEWSLVSLNVDSFNVKLGWMNVCNLWDMNLTSVADGVLQWSSNSHFSQLLQAGTNGTLADGCPWSNRNPRLEHPSSIGLSGGVGWSTPSEQIRIPDLLHLIYLLLPDFDRGNKSGARARPRSDHGGARVRLLRFHTYVIKSFQKKKIKILVKSSRKENRYLIKSYQRKPR